MLGPVFIFPVIRIVNEGVESRLLLDFIVAQRTKILKLLPGEDDTLLVGGDSLLVLDFALILSMVSDGST